MDNDELFSTTYKLYFNSLYNYGMKISRNKELVEDSIQELFFRIWKNKIDLQIINNPKSYLLKGLRHQIFNMLDLKNYQLEKVEIRESVAIEFSDEDLFVQNYGEEEIRKKVLGALNELSAKKREAIYLRYFEDMAYNSIAEIMNINVQSAKNNVQRGIKFLRDYLGIMDAILLFMLTETIH
jgi:RNA polymerase sigma factor (sigma-70 family)